MTSIEGVPERVPGFSPVERVSTSSTIRWDSTFLVLHAETERAKNEAMKGASEIGRGS